MHLIKSKYSICQVATGYEFKLTVEMGWLIKTATANYKLFRPEHRIIFRFYQMKTYFMYVNSVILKVLHSLMYKPDSSW